MPEERVRTECTSCGARLKVPAKAAGKRVRCPKCGDAFRVDVAAELDVAPAAAPAAESAFDDDALAQLGQGDALESGDELRDRLEAAAAHQAPLKKSAAAPADSERPARTGIGWSRWGANFFGILTSRRDLIGRGCLVAIILGGVLVFMGIREGRIRGRTNTVPQELTCEQLALHGPGDNLHVIMSDFYLMPSYVYQEGAASWSGAWVPAISFESYERHLAAQLNVPIERLKEIDEDKIAEAEELLDPGIMGFNVIVSLPKAQNEYDVEAAANSDSLQGIVLNDFSKLDSDTRNLLEDGYSNVDLDKCWILVAGREPKSAEATLGMLAGGAALCVAGLVVAGWRATWLGD